MSFISYVTPWQGYLFFLVPLLAWGLDSQWGMPQYLQPAKGIESFCSRYTDAIHFSTSPINIACCIVGLLCLATVVLISTLLALPWGIGWCFAVYLSWGAFTLGTLLREGKHALIAIQAAEEAKQKLIATPSSLQPLSLVISEEEEQARLQLDTARVRVGVLASCHTSTMSCEKLYQTLAETLSKNFTDSCILPCFLLCSCGSAGVWGYKVLRTAEPIWRNQRDSHSKILILGKKIDSIFAYIPARLSLFVLYLAGTITGHTHNWPGYAQVVAQARLAQSSRRGFSMAAVAWLCHARMGGREQHDTEYVGIPLFGSLGSVWNAQKIQTLLHLLRIAGGLATLILIGIWGAVYTILQQLI